jgi:leader peptidase (prepilin peptidase)/N-methyltransferase
VEVVVALAVLAGVLGGLVVGPRIAETVQRWIGWRVVLPLLLGWVPPRSETRPARIGASAHPPYQRSISVVTGVMFALVTLRFGWSVALPPVLILVAGLVALSTVDLVCWRVPSRFVYWTGAGVVGGLAIAAAAIGEPGSLVGAAVGGGVYLAMLGVMHLAAPGQMGFGDVRLGALIGLVVGWMGWDSAYPVYGPLGWALFGLIVASLLGTVAGLVVLAVRHRAKRLSGRFWRESYPYGPWLCLGGLIAILAAAPGPA